VRTVTEACGDTAGLLRTALRPYEAGDAPCGCLDPALAPDTRGVPPRPHGRV